MGGGLRLWRGVWLWRGVCLVESRLDDAGDYGQGLVECPGSLSSYQERLLGFQPRVCEPDQMLPQPALQPFVAGPVAPVADEGFESVVDARKLLAASQPLVGPAPWPWC